MSCKVYINLNEKELRALCTARKNSGLKSYRETILSACNSEIVRSLSFMILAEKELRKISVNHHQIIRSLEQSGASFEELYSVDNSLDFVIDEVTKIGSSLHVLDAIKDSERKELAIRMAAEEKTLLCKIKKILRFKTYRAMILTLCIFTDMQITMPDVSLEYPALKNYGLEINKAAKTLNSGNKVDDENFKQFLDEFNRLLMDIAQKLRGGKNYVA